MLLLRERQSVLMHFFILKDAKKFFCEDFFFAYMFFV